MQKIRQVVAVMLAALMAVTMLPQNSMQSFAAEAVAIESTETVSDNNNENTEKQEDTSGEDSAVGDEDTGEDSSDGNEDAADEDASGKEDAAGEDEPVKEEDQEDASGEDNGEEAEQPEGISENTIDETVTLFGMENEVQSISSDADFVISSGVLTGYTGTATELVIPDGVTKIGDGFLKNNKTVTSVKFSANVTSVGNSAFSGCTALAKVELNEGLTEIGVKAFAEAAFGQKLSTGAVEKQKLTIPSTVQKIGKGAFQGSAYLREVVFADGDTTELTVETSLYDNLKDEKTFANCSSLERVVLPKRLKLLPAYAFQDCKGLKEVTLGEDLEEIGNYAFCGCESLKEIVFPNQVKSVGNFAFKGCTSLGRAELNEGLVTIGEQAFAEAAFGQKLSTGAVEKQKLMIPCTVQKIGKGAFQGSAYLREVVFEDGDTEVLTIESALYSNLNDEKTFANCESLERVVLPKRLKTLPAYTFENCKKLKEVTLGEGLEEIGNYAFNGCESLKEIVFPNQVKSVGNFAFKGCTSLGRADLNEGLVTIGEQAFAEAAFGQKLSTGAVEKQELTIPSTVQKIGKGAFRGSAYLREVVFEDGDTEVLTIESALYSNLDNEKTFANCASLERVLLPKRLKTLPAYAFENCAKLKAVYIPETVTQIGNQALIGCPQLTIYGTPGSEAERYAKANNIKFSNKSALKLSVESVSLNRKTITKVGEAAMGQTVQLTATVLPESAQNKSVAWTSSDSSVAAVDGSGLVTITGCGKATITVTTNDGNKQASCAVTVLRQWTQAELDEIKTALQTQNDSGWTVVTNRLTDIRDLEIKVPAGAQYTAEWKLDYAVDTGANNHYDIRIRQEGYQDAVLRGFTVTGVTLEGLTVSAPNQVMKVETGKELTLTAEPSISGLTGDITAADLYKVEWKSANPSALSIGTVSQVSDITPAQAHVKGVKKASNVAVTATLVLLDQDQVPYAKDKNKKGRTWFETTVKISVLTQSVTDQIVITALDRQEQPVELSSLRELLMSEQETVYHLKAEVSAGGTPVASPKLTWKSSNTALATVTGSDAAVTLKIKGKQKGTAVISATAAKDSGHVEKFRVVVKDSKPRLEETNLTFNLYKETLQETVHLLPSDGYQVKSESLKILNNDKGKTDSAFFEIRKDEENENSYRISVKAGKEPKTGRQKLLLSVTTSAEEQEPHQIPFTVQVVKAAPKLTIKQEAVDLYRKGAQGTVHLTSSEEIEDIQYVSTTGDASARLVQKTKDVTEGVFTFGLENATAANYKKAGAKGKLLVTFKGYSEEASYNKALTLSVNKKLPVVKAVAEHGVLYPETPLDSTKIRFRDKDGNALPGSISVERDGNAPKKTEITIEDQQQSYDVRVKVLKGAAGRITTKWKVRAADWYEPVKVSCAIQTQKKTALSFENSTLNLSTFYDLEQYEPASTGMILKGFEDREIVSTTVSGADKKSVEAQKALVFGQEDNRLTVGIADADFFKKAGTYQYMVKARFADSRTVEGKIKIAVKKAAASASLKAKGSIDLLNRQGTEIVYTAALKNYTDRVAAVNLYGECAGSFRCTYSEEDGKIHLRAKEGAFLKQKTPYKLKVCLTLGSGVELVAPVTVKLQQKAVKLQKSTETVTLFESVNQSACTKKIDFSVKDHVNGVEISSVTLVNNFDTFSYRHDGEGAGKIWVSEIPSGKVNKKYTLKFAVTFKDGATNAAPAYVTVKVDYRK